VQALRRRPRGPRGQLRPGGGRAARDHGAPTAREDHPLQPHRGRAASDVGRIGSPAPRSAGGRPTACARPASRARSSWCGPSPGSPRSKTCWWAGSTAGRARRRRRRRPRRGACSRVAWLEARANEPAARLTLIDPQAAPSSPARWRPRPGSLLLDEFMAGLNPMETATAMELVRDLVARRREPC